MSKHVVPDEVLTRPEPLSEAERLTRVPATPFAFLRFLIFKHFRGRVAALVALAGTATSIEAFGPYALSHLINAITAAVQEHASFTTAILPWLLLLATLALIQDEASVTEVVLQAMAKTEDARLRAVMAALVSHLHAFLREVRPTDEEFERALADIEQALAVLCADRFRGRHVDA